MRLLAHLRSMFGLNAPSDPRRDALLDRIAQTDGYPSTKSEVPFGMRLLVWRMAPPSEARLRVGEGVISQNQMARMVDLPRSTYGDIERGLRLPTDRERALIEKVTGPL